MLPASLSPVLVTRAVKCLTIHYCRNIISAYGVNSPAAGLARLTRFLPAALQQHPFHVSFGEMLVLARKQG